MWSGGRLSDMLMWSRRAMFAGVLSSGRATCPNTEVSQRDRRWDSEVRPVRCSSSSFQTRLYHWIPSSCLRHFWWKASRVLTSADSKVQVSEVYSIALFSLALESLSRQLAQLFMSMYSWIADGSRQQFSVKVSSTSLHDILTQALMLRNIAPESGICLFLVLEMFVS